MRFTRILRLGLVLSTFVLAGALVMAQDNADPQAKIDNAMSAAPSEVSAEATILDNEVDDTGAFIILQEGSNSWTCFPDNPGSPGNDPLCLDPAFMQWYDALVAGEEPNLTAPGLAYMLQGGSDASNTDPSLLEPAEGEDWVSTPPHIMIAFPDDIDPALFSTDHEAGGPYVMWAGTPYEHIMMPVTDHEH